MQDIVGPGDKIGAKVENLDLQMVVADSLIIFPIEFSPANDKPCLQFELYGCECEFSISVYLFFSSSAYEKISAIIIWKVFIFPL